MHVRSLGLGALAAAVCAVVASAAVASADPGRPPPDRCASAGVFCVGAASVDMTWHVGAGQGQLGTQGNGVTSDKFDPFHHQTHVVPSDGLQSRSYAKAIVARGAEGEKVAYVKTDLYLQQDLLARRVGELVAGDPLAPDLATEGLDGSRIMLSATHSHSTPYYASTAAGVWVFADTFDFRMFEAAARDVAAAIKAADAALVPARVGAAVSRFDDVQRNIIGPAVADDATPAGFPHDHFDDELTVIRFDTADSGRPIAAWVNFGMHPESIDTVDLLSSDFVGMVERMVERGMGRRPGAASGPVVAWSQGSVGDVEPDQARASPPAAGTVFWRRNFAQAERMSRSLAGAVLETWRDVARATPEVPDKFVPFTTTPGLGMVDYRFAGPPAHPLPTVDNCRTDQARAPSAAACERVVDPPEQYGTTLDLLRGAGLPVPDSALGVPSYHVAQESTRIHLQAIRIGDILIASCPCEPISDMVLNFKSRADAVAGNQYLGFEWPCRAEGSAVRCDFSAVDHLPPDPRPVDRDAYLRMRAQVRNDAAGWEDDYASAQGQAEPRDVRAIRGNFTHEELGAGLRQAGYRLPIMVGQANDYIGYVVTYREFQRGDHYRKALTAFGPRTADYVNTRLVRMAAELRGGPRVAGGGLEPVIGPADELLQVAKTMAAGTAGGVGTPLYEAALPDDGGVRGAAVSQPVHLERFGAAAFAWQGGSNWTDSPVVTVERRDHDGAWRTVATQEGGEVVVTLAYDRYTSDAPLLWLTGDKTYVWTATWEAFETTDPGTYRFAVEGLHRRGGTANVYRTASHPFNVSVWRGLVPHDLVVDPDSGTASFAVDGVERQVALDRLETDDDAVLGPEEVHYPDTYRSELPYIRTDLTTVGSHRFCFRCAFRPWADTGRVVTAVVTVEHARPPGGVPSHAGGKVRTTRHVAALEGDRWVVRDLRLHDGDFVSVLPGDVVDEYGNTNGLPSNRRAVELRAPRTGGGPR